MSENVLATDNFNKFILENRISTQTIQELINSCVLSKDKFAQIEIKVVGKKRFIRAHFNLNHTREILLSIDKDYN